MIVAEQELRLRRMGGAEDQGPRLCHSTLVKHSFGAKALRLGGDHSSLSFLCLWNRSWTARSEETEDEDLNVYSDATRVDSYGPNLDLYSGEIMNASTISPSTQFP